MSFCSWKALNGTAAFKKLLPTCPSLVLSTQSCCVEGAALSNTWGGEESPSFPIPPGSLAVTSLKCWSNEKKKKKKIISCNLDDINPWGCDLVAVIYFSPPFFDDEWLEWFWFCFVCRCRYIISSSVHSFSSLVFFQVLLLSTFSCCVAVWRVHLYLACFATISSQSQAVEQPGGAAPFMRNQPAFDFCFYGFLVGILVWFFGLFFLVFSSWFVFLQTFT